MHQAHVCGVLLCAILMATHVVKCKYYHDPVINGWVGQYKTIATWDEALQQCQTDGAVLMSPLNTNLLAVMHSLIRRDTAHFIGTRANFHPRIFASIEGVLLDDMPLTEMYEQLDPHEGQCLSMTHDRIRPVPCSSRLPYMCYKEETPDQVMTECGTFDKGYQLNNITEHCYKFHTNSRFWKEAYATCVNEGGYLAVVDDEVEAKQITEMILDKSYYVLIGLHDWQGNGDWKSITGVPVQSIYNSWENGKSPNNSRCDIGTIHPRTGKLKDFEADTESNFICEKDPKSIMFSKSLWN